MKLPRRPLRVAAIAVLLGWSAACSSSGAAGPTRPALRWPDDTTASAAIPGVPVSTPFVFYIGEMCVADDPVEVTGVTLGRTEGHLQLLDWGFRRRSPGDSYSSGRNDPGADPGRLSNVPGFTHGPVSVKCSDHRHSDQLDVNVQMTAPGVAVSHGFWVDYRDPSGTHRSPAFFTLTLCTKRCPRSR
jgi:hypothetical protein